MNSTSEPVLALQGGQPLDRDICDQIRGCILCGALWPGEQLPSVRALAVALAVNPRAVERAYVLLENEGLASTENGNAVVCGTPWQQGSLSALCAGFLESAIAAGHAPQAVIQTMRSLIERTPSS